MNKYFVILAATAFLNSVVQAKEPFDLSAFEKPPENPVLKPDATIEFLCPVKKQLVAWQRADVFNPAAIVKDGKVYILFRAEDDPKAGIGGRTSRIGLAYSDDGLHFTKYPTPVLYPDVDPQSRWDSRGGCEDPRVVQTEDGLYVLAYTAWDKNVARLSMAMSTDLIHWEKKGPAFQKAYNGKFINHWSKSASIVTKLVGDKIVAVKINGKYWMYWGEHATNLAWSENLCDWYPAINGKGDLKMCMPTREGKFDSALVECGPPALLTEDGIVLIYNGKNRGGNKGDQTLPGDVYSVGKVVFDLNDMEKVISRTDTCLIKPTLPHEKSGQYKGGTVFAEGLVYFKSKWFLYYGTADSFVGVAVSK